MQIPDYALTALQKLEASGYKAYIVGGCVRDSLLGLRPKDYDIASSARPEQVLALFGGYKTITAGQKHGTVGVVIGGEVTEITTFRSDGLYADHRRPETVNFTSRVEDDLARRDFTVNAMAYSPAHGIVDPFGGARDLREGVLRAVGDPGARFGEDALRILRGVRFASVYGLEPEPATARAMLAQAPLLSAISAERVCAELYGALRGRYAEKYIYKFCGVFEPVLPELAALARRADTSCADTPCADTPRAEAPSEEALCDGEVSNYSDVPDHGEISRRGAVPYYGDMLKKSLAVVSRLDGQIWLLLAALFQNVDARGREASAATASGILRRLKTDRETRENTALLIREPELSSFSRAELRRLIARLSPERATAYLRLRLASAETAGGGDEAEAYSCALELTEEILRSGECVSRSALELSGGDLAALGVPPGKKMGELLEALFGEVLDGRLENTKPALAARALELIGGGA